MIAVRRTWDDDEAWISALLDTAWGGPTQVVNGRSYRPVELPGFVAEIDGERVGYAALEVDGPVAWIALIHALRPGQGVGRELIEAMAERARDEGCTAIRAVTTNDNTGAQAFYGALGFRVREIRRGAVDAARGLKPSIPGFAADGVPISDEIEFERLL